MTRHDFYDKTTIGEQVTPSSGDYNFHRWTCKPTEIYSVNSKQTCKPPELHTIMTI